jgi:cytochrome c oxidase subunit 2
MHASPRQGNRRRRVPSVPPAARNVLVTSAAILITGFFLASPAAAQDNGRPIVSHGLSYLTGFGPKNYPVVSLLWAEIILCLAVAAIIAILVLAGSLWRRRVATGGMELVPLERSGSGLSFIYIGIGITFPVLVGFAVWNYYVLASIAGPRTDAPVTIEVTGHQWWWEVRYLNGDQDHPAFVTANEIHIPLRTPVKVVLHTADVIHSFWVPALSGKMDTIPGQNNTTWLQADQPGIYRGQCTEYCGQQHAHMGFIVTAESQSAFDRWWSEQASGPKFGEANTGAQHGQNIFMQHCAVCHTVRGTLAQGKIGPDLSHLMERKTIAAATLPNTIGALSGWISNPQHIKPGNYMPTLTLTAVELSSLRDFLKTLQ